GLVVILRPFHDLSVTADFGRRKTTTRRVELRTELAIEVKDFRGADRLPEQPVDDLVIHRRPHAQNADLPVRQAITVLGRDGWAADQPSFWIWNEVVEKELRRFL